IDLKKELKNDLESSSNPSPRIRMDEEETRQIQIDEEISKLKSVPQKIWQKIADWGRDSGSLDPQKITVACNIPLILRRNTKIDDKTRQAGITVLDLVIKQAPEILEEIDHQNAQETIIKLIRKIVEWDTQNHKLEVKERQFMIDLAEGSKELTEVSKKIAAGYLRKVQGYGFGA
ncbi:MAG: hypothetical protein ABWZ66_12915, partial [Pyrinomonadaceae bacterium]